MPVTGSLKPAVTVLATSTPVALAAGVRGVTVGLSVSWTGGSSAAAALLNVHDVGVSVLAAVSRIPAVRDTVWLAPACRGADGVRVAVRVIGSYPTVASTGPLGPASVTLLPSTPLTASLNVAVTALSGATPTAPAAGSRLVTVGRVVSAPAAVVKLHEVGASALPEVSVTSLVTVTVMTLPAVRVPVGLMVTTRVAGS